MDKTDTDLMRQASLTARAAELHFPADQLADAADIVDRLDRRVDQLTDALATIIADAAWADDVVALRASIYAAAKPVVGTHA